MFPTPQVTPVTPEQVINDTQWVLGVFGLDSAIVVIIALFIAITGFWWLVGRRGHDD